MEIREATIEDIDILNAFYIRMNEIINVRTNKYNPDNPVFPSYEMINDAILNHEQFVGIEDGIIVCACIANHSGAAEYENAKWQITIKKEEYLVLHALRVLPEYERRGFAKQMIGWICQVAKERNQKAVRLDVLEDYGIEQLYTSSGFKYMDTIEILYEDIGSMQRFRLFEKVI